MTNIYKTKLFIDQCKIVMSLHEHHQHGWYVAFDFEGPNYALKKLPVHHSVLFFNTKHYDTYVEAAEKGTELAQIMDFNLSGKVLIIRHNAATYLPDSPQTVDLDTLVDLGEAIKIA